MKQIFIVYGEAAVGKSTLFRKAVKVDLLNEYADYIFCKEKPKSIVLDSVVAKNEQTISDIIKFVNRSDVDYLIIIINHDLHLLTEKLKPLSKLLNIPISICEMRKV